MAELVRFTAPVPDLSLPAVPAIFVNFVCDIPADQTARLARMRYLGAPYGVEERGVTTDDEPWPTRDEIAEDLADPNSTIGQALTARLGGGDVAELRADVDQLRDDVDTVLARPGGGGVVIGNELPADLDDGALAIRLRTY